MNGRESFFDLGLIEADRRSRVPLFRQIYESLRESILERKLAGGAGIPSSRELAALLGLSRMTVISAYEQLLAEGYLVTKRGSGTFVSESLPEEQQRVSFRARGDVGKVERTFPTLREFAHRRQGRIKLSTSCKRLVEQKSNLPKYLPSLRPFRAGVPALDQFPIEMWAKLSRARWRKFSASDLSYGPAAGLDALRESVAEYVQAFRGVRCDASQVMIVSGTQQAVDICARLLLDPGDQVLFEDPGYRTARAALAAAGAQIMPMPVDTQGAIVSEGARLSPHARLAYVTPSHQFPLGVTLSIERRMELIHWAHKNQGMIIEDDYDSEYRYAHRPIPSLQGLDSGERTIYIGSFAKVIFPALSLGYAIIPSCLIPAFEAALTLVGRPPSILDQTILTDFIVGGHFSRHLRRMRKVHESRRTALVESLTEHLGDRVEIIGADAGLHCTALFRDGVLTKSRSARDIVEGICRMDYVVRLLSEYYMPSRRRKHQPEGLIFGFASSTPRQLKTAVREILPAFG